MARALTRGVLSEGSWGWRAGGCRGAAGANDLAVQSGVEHVARRPFHRGHGVEGIPSSHACAHGRALPNCSRFSAGPALHSWRLRGWAPRGLPAVRHARRIRSRCLTGTAGISQWALWARWALTPEAITHTWSTTRFPHA